MSESSAAALAATSLDDDAWDDLLSFIEERRVIPIVGPELLHGRRPRAVRACSTTGWPSGWPRGSTWTCAALPQPYTLNDVVCWFLAARGRREEAYVRLRSIIKDADFEPPEALRHLAAITDFDLFVSTTFDSLLENAINLERFGGAARRRGAVLCAEPRRRPALPSATGCAARWSITCSASSSASPTYVISDEDLLEFICALQSEHLAPEKLFHELEHNHLLFIGSNFTNWLARLFLRMAKRQRLSDPRDVGEVLADDHTSQDDRLVAFLQQVSVRTRIYLGAERFVEELHARWHARRKPAPAARAARPARFLPPAREMPDNAVFISYAREDLPAVQQHQGGARSGRHHHLVRHGPARGGRRLRPQDPRNIARCSYFIPVVSATTQRRLEGYFRREWSYAIDRARNMADGALFILPVTHRWDTTAAEALVPDKFKALHFTRAAGRARCRPSSRSGSRDFMRARGR